MRRERELTKPAVIRVFEEHFKIKAEHCEDIFFLRVAPSWEDFFRSIFCYINDSSLMENNLIETQDLTISRKGVVLSGRMLLKDNCWGSMCILAQGKLKTSPASGRLVKDLSDGIYLLSWSGSDILNLV